MERALDIRYDPRRVYRLIGGDLYSARVDRPLGKQSYELELPRAVEDPEGWHVRVRDGSVVLESGQT